MSSKIETKLLEKEELQVLLAQYKSILNNEVMEYLMELLELKTSFIKAMQLDIAKNESLRELSLYKQIAIYNIYHRALNIAKEMGIVPIISDKKSSNFSISTKIGEDCVPLFLFHTSKKEKRNGNDFGTIDLYRAMFDNDIKAQMLEEMRKRFQNLEEDYNYIGYQYYKDLIQKLEKEKELSDEELKQIELTQNIQQILIEDYGLTQDSFMDEFDEKLKKAKNESEKNFLHLQNKLENYSSPYAIKSAEKEIVLVKKFSNMEIRNITKYII